MMSVPAEIATRWAPMWRAGHPSRPWWFYEQLRSLDAHAQDVRTYPNTLKLTRVDGVEFRYRAYPPAPRRIGNAGPPWIPGWYQTLDLINGRRTPVATDPDPTGPITEVLAKWDEDQPLPAPPLMPGQVWIVNGEELSIMACSPSGSAMVAGAVLGDGGDTIFRTNSTHWNVALRTHGVLVSGPTPWGRDVPWAPVAASCG